ncbi:hypothetical protein D3C85_898910 [compost metagenome]
MAMSVSHCVVGVDVAKAEAVVYQADTDQLSNDKPALKQWLHTLPANSAIAIEATNIYHLRYVCNAGSGRCEVLAAAKSAYSATMLIAF